MDFARTAIAATLLFSWTSPIRASRAQEPQLANEHRDSLSVVRYLRFRKLKLLSVPAARERYYAAIAAAADGAHRYVVPLRVQGNTVSSLVDKPLEVGEYDPTELVWFSIDLRNGSSSVDGLMISWDLGAEGRAGTTIMSLREAVLTTTYQDPPAICTPSLLKDVTGDGSVELVTYTDQKGDCSDVCRLTIQKHFDLPPAWVELRSWTGAAWQVKTDGTSQFYAKLADKYSQIRRWLSGEWGPDSELCRGVAWVEDGAVFEKWVGRAREVAVAQPAKSQ